MRLSKLGYGDIMTVKNLDVQTFIDLIHYEEFLDRYTQTVRSMNENGR